MSKTSISTNQELRIGEYLMSSDGKSKAVFEENGVFVVYHMKPIWSTPTAGKGGLRIVMQEDQNLVMYNKKKEPLWATNTGQLSEHSTRLSLTMTNSGSLVLSNNGADFWCSPAAQKE